ncbi:MAG: hypothetical protein M1831_004468 [Alyxoria varia]|nr:MAG: hypothetical protein M1831_004468 [Alyxoria varia]
MHLNRTCYVFATLATLAAAITRPQTPDKSTEPYWKRDSDDSDSDADFSNPPAPNAQQNPPVQNDDNTQEDFLRIGDDGDKYVSSRMSEGNWREIDTGWITTFRQDLLQGCNPLLDNRNTYITQGFRRVEENPFEYNLPNNPNYRSVIVFIDISMGMRLGSLIHALNRHLVQTPPVSRNMIQERPKYRMENVPYRGERRYVMTGDDRDVQYFLQNPWAIYVPSSGFAMHVIAKRRRRPGDIYGFLDLDDVRPTWQSFRREYGCLAGLSDGGSGQGGGRLLDADGTETRPLQLGLAEQNDANNGTEPPQ